MVIILGGTGKALENTESIMKSVPLQFLQPRAESAESLAPSNTRQAPSVTQFCSLLGSSIFIEFKDMIVAHSYFIFMQMYLFLIFAVIFLICTQGYVFLTLILERGSGGGERERH